MEVAVEELVGMEVAMQEVLPCVEQEAGSGVDMNVSNNLMPESSKRPRKSLPC